MDVSSGNDNNGSKGPDASASDEHDGVHFGWSDEMAADLEPPLNLSFVTENENENRNEEVENEANRNRPAESGVNEKEADGNGENEANGADENKT
ncbi:hypothetical protein V6N13_071368 [Hibiscus sabdariffa]|uniref:Uncharacterized protein n=1 Tax=Hibiscus sabdariffa TaxID=183260 RepID=A0ABR2TE07_9ROSI